MEDNNETGQIAEASPKPSLLRQWVACISVYFLSLTIGAGAALSGVAVLAVASKEDGFDMTDDQISWFAGMQTFAMIPTCLFGGLLGEWVGRRTACILVTPLFIMGNLCMVFAKDIHLLYFGRVLCGMGGGLVSSPAGVLVTEITTVEMRTTFNSMLSTFYMVGALLIYFLGKWLHWRSLVGVSSVLPLIGIILLITIVPESPAWLVTKGRFKDSKKSLQWYRGPHFDITQEFDSLRKSYAKTQDSSNADTGKDQNCLTTSIRKIQNLLLAFRRADVWKPFAIISSIMFLQQFSGIANITYYAVSIMEKSGSAVDKYTATIIFGIIRLGSCFLGSWLLSKLSRKLLLVSSSFTLSFGMFLLGLAVYLKEDAKQDVVEGFLGYLPLIAANIVAISYQLGLGPIPWSYCSELYPVDMRARLSGLSNCIANLYVFMTIKTFPAMQSGISNYGAFWFNSCMGILAGLFGLTLLPDTKGKTLAEVSDYFTHVCCIIGGRNHNQELEMVKSSAGPDGEADEDKPDEKDNLVKT